MALVNDKVVFEINAKGETTGRVYTGSFTMKLFLSLKDRSRAAVEFSKVNSGNTEDQELANINKTVCEYLIMSETAPEWFQPSSAFDLQDFSPLVAIKDEIEKAQAEYSEKINK
jgi:hypothetical protein